MARVRVQIPVPDEAPAAPAPMVEQPQPAREQSYQVPRLPQVANKSKLVTIVAVIVVAVLFMMVLNDRNQLRNEVKKQSAGQQQGAAQTDVLKYQAEVGKIVELPSGQTPSLVTVSDAKKLAGENPFFKNAQDGDVVLLYVSQDKSVRAILYRPATHKVVEATSSASIGAAATPTTPGTTGTTKR